MCYSTYRDGISLKCDVVNMHSLDREDKSDGKALVKLQNTLENDLKLTEEELLDRIKKNCKYEIRRAAREGAYYKMVRSDELLQDKQLVDHFEITYNNMFSAKKVPGYTFNRSMINNGIKSGNIFISTCTPLDRLELVVYHAYLCDEERTMLLYSASPLWSKEDKNSANIIGRINKYAHWQDIKWFKDNEYKIYEWGGIHSTSNPNGIDKFKMEFGGELVSYFNYTIPRSILGKIYAFLVKKRSNQHMMNLDAKKEKINDK